MISDKNTTLSDWLKLKKPMILSNHNNENNVLNLPYKLAKFTKGKKNYISFYVFDENLNKLKRIKKEVPKGVDQKTWVKAKIKQINEVLVQGYRIISAQTETEIDAKPECFTFSFALEKISKIRSTVISKNTHIRQKSFKNSLLSFFQNKGWELKMLSSITQFHIQEYIDSLDVNNNSKNSYISYVKAVFSDMTKRGWIKENTAEKIKKYRAHKTRSVAFESDDLPTLKKLVQEHSDGLYVFCMMIFYTFIRPIELRRLKVKQVSLKDRKIYIDGSQSKNSDMAYVMIPKPLEKIFMETKFLERDKNDNLFDPEDLAYSRNKYSKAFSKIIQKEKFPSEYQIYSWKHTGVCEFYKKGARLKFIQMQCRHASLDETDKYLKRLGLFDNDDILNNAPEID